MAVRLSTTETLLIPSAASRRSLMAPSGWVQGATATPLEGLQNLIPSFVPYFPQAKLQSFPMKG